jgi:hypothetical protein
MNNEGMISNRVKAAILVTSLCLCPTLARSQDDPAATSQLAEEKARQNDRPCDPRSEGARHNDETQRRRDAQLQRDRERFIAAFQQFQSASRELGQAVVFNKEVKAPAVKIDDSTKVFLDFLKSQNKTRAIFSPAELKNHKVQELALEALTTADRVTPSLGAVMDQQKSDAFDIQFLAAIPSLEMELLRLQWIVRHLK